MTTHKIDNSYHQKEISVEAGDLLEITLEGNATTGYKWQVDESSSSNISLLEDTYAASESSLPGAGALHIFKFKILKKENSFLKLVNRQPWNPQEIYNSITIKLI